MNDKVPEANVAFKYDYLQRELLKSGLKIKSEHFGYWRGRPKSSSLNFQDILILEKSS